jgi:AcrR family transcriptional regulator
MAREKDAEKRQAILAEAKRLFAERGFHATSVADIVRGIDIPVGSVYTYFKTKEELIETIIEEGWAAFRDDLAAALEAESLGERKLALVVNRFLPALFADADFISLLLTESLNLGAVGEKLNYLSSLLGGIIEQTCRESGRAINISQRDAVAGLLLFFLGAMDSVRIMRATPLPVSEADLIGFIRLVIANAFGIDLSATAP